MTPKEVKQAIKDGKEVFFDDVSYPWSLGIKDRPDTATYKVVKAKGLNTYHLEFFKFTRHTKDGVKFDATEFARKSHARLNLPPIRAIVKNSTGEVLIGNEENYYIKQ
mgnify:FL=1